MRKIRNRHQHREQELPSHVGGHHSESDPVVAARDSLLHIGKRVGGNNHAGEVERKNEIVVEPRRDEIHAARGKRRDAHGDPESDPTASADEPTQQSDKAALAVFRNETLRGGSEPEIDGLAEQQHPGPDIDIDAELEAAHPAREQHLRAECQKRAGDADHEDGAGKALHQKMLGVEQARLDGRPGGGTP